MQETSIKLYTGAYETKPRTEYRMMLLAAVGVALQLALVLYLIFSKSYSTAVVAVFLINLITVACFWFVAWLDGNPKYRRHLTLSEEGVCYRSRFMQPEQEFDWEEVDQVYLELFKVTFVLKNEEEHIISLEQIRNDNVLKQVREQIEMMVSRKSITLV